MKKKLTLENACSKYGASMGRRDAIPDDYAGEKLNLTRLPFVDLAYDRWGAYWGMPANVWCAWGESASEQVRIFVRGDNRHLAAAQVLKKVPSATFSVPVDEIVNGTRVRCFMLLGNAPDCWTVVYPDQKENPPGSFACVGMSGHSSAMLGRHLGRRVRLADLPEHLQRVVAEDCAIEGGNEA